MQQAVIVYGSAADPTNRSPRDVDVAYTGHRREAEQIVAEWTRRRGLSRLPVDWHPTRHVDGVVHLPAPCGQEGPYEVIAGDARVKWNPKYGLASYVRVYGSTPAKLAAELRNRKAWWRLTVVPAPGRKPDREREYVEGLTALRSAVSKNPAARAVLAAQWPSLFPTLLDTDPRPGRDALESLRGASPWASGGAGIVVLTSSGVHLQYGSGAEDIAQMLYPEAQS